MSEVRSVEDVTPFLDALDSYIDHGYATWRKYGVPADVAAEMAKHMASAVIGIRRRLNIPVADPTRYLPGFRRES